MLCKVEREDRCSHTLQAVEYLVCKYSSTSKQRNCAAILTWKLELPSTKSSLDSTLSPSDLDYGTDRDYKYWKSRIATKKPGFRELFHLFSRSIKGIGFAMKKHGKTHKFCVFSRSIKGISLAAFFPGKTWLWLCRYTVVVTWPRVSMTFLWLCPGRNSEWN